MIWSLLRTGVDLFLLPACNFDLLKVERLDQREELIFRVLQFVVDQPIGEEDGIVGAFDLVDRRLNPHLELLLRLNSITNALPQLFKRWRVNEKEVTFEGLSVDFLGSLHVHFNDWNFAHALYASQLCVRRAIAHLVVPFATLNELLLIEHRPKLLPANKVKIFF